MTYRTPAIAAAILILAAVAVVSCSTYAPPATPAPQAHGSRPRVPPPTATAPAPPRPADRFPARMPLAAVTHEPLVRVRVVNAAARVRLETNAAATISTADGQSVQLTPPLTVTRTGNAFTIAQSGGGGQALRWAVPALTVRGGPTITVDGKTYPGSITLHEAQDDEGRPTPARTGLDAINHVPLETYVPGVLEHELYASWEPAAYRAQAIAVRSYALDRIARARAVPGKDFDLESTTASQVYGGSATRPKATAAARATLGQVLAFDGHVVPAYYSSDTGGSGQDAAVAFPGERPIPPLAAFDRGAWSQVGGSTKFRWGPIRRDRADLARRIAAWGAAQKTQHPVADLRGLSSVTVATRNRVGRPASFTLVDGSGRTFTMAPEQFRFACNYAAATPLPPALQLPSSHVAIAPAGAALTFTGQGFGHGVGLCQWGAQGMAQRRHPHDQILATYYPGATLTKLY